MKNKPKTVLALFVGIMLGVVLACVGYELIGKGGNVDWKVYIEEKVIPVITLAGSAISLILVAAIPIVNRVKTAVTLFSTATEDVNNTVNVGKSVAQSVSDYGGRINTLSSSFDSYRTATEEELKQTQEELARVKKMIEIGFGNNEHLVKNGYARQIMALSAGKENGGNTNGGQA